MNLTPDPAACAAFLILAFVLAGVAQVFWLRSNASMHFSMPLDGGLTFRGRRVFGSHKMLRGFVVMSPATSASFVLVFWMAGVLAPEFEQMLWPLPAWRYAVVGMIAGLGFMAGELPNSFIKRQLGIPPGGAPSPATFRAALFLVDRLDSIIGMLIALSLVVPVPLGTWTLVITAGVALHWFFSAVLFAFGVKERVA